MNRLIAVILLVVYSGTASGFSVQLHYCMDHLVNWSLWSSKSDTCQKCGMPEKEAEDKGCCKDVHKQIKIDSDQKLTEVRWQDNAQNQYTLPLNPDFSASNFISRIPAIDIADHNPSKSSSVRTHIRHCVFLI